jgi:hypothetical protein
VVIAGEVSGRGDSLAYLFNDKVEILRDVEHDSALSLGLAFHAGDEMPLCFHVRAEPADVSCR